MSNKIFEYGDIVYFLDSKGKIDTGTFSEDWVAGGEAWSFVNQRGHQIHIWTENLFDSEINLLLSLEKKKTSLIVKIQNNLPVLEQELIKVKNKIKKRTALSNRPLPS